MAAVGTVVEAVTAGAAPVATRSNMEERAFFDLDARIGALSQRLQLEDPRASSALQEALLVSWILHDSALDGIVLSRQEILTALSGAEHRDLQQEARHCAIRAHKSAIDLITKNVQLPSGKPTRTGVFTAPLLKRLHELLTPQSRTNASPYRTGIPAHRAYHHRIVPANEIPQRLSRLCTLLDAMPDDGPPVARAAAAHAELLTIYPWSQNSGKIARLLMNQLLLRDGYPPALILGTDRQRYYQCLCIGSESLAELVADSLDSYCLAANQFFDSLAGKR